MKLYQPQNAGSPPRYLQELEGHVSPAQHKAGLNNVAQVCRRLRRTGLGFTQGL